MNTEVRKIRIEIVQTDGTSENPQTMPVGDINTTYNVPKITSKNSVSKINEIKQTSKSVLLHKTYDLAKKTIIQTIDANLNQYFNLSEDYLAETTYSNVKKTLSKIGGLGLAISGGFAFGGPIGAGISLIGYGISESINFQSRLSSFYQDLNATNYQSNFNQVRSGLINGSKGTEN